MKNSFLSIGKKLWKRFISKEYSQSIIIFLSKIADINLIYLSYKQMGILNFENNFVTGEEYVIKKVLNQYIKQPAPIFFDIGAHLGNYSLELRSQFPTANIFAFEPNPHTYKSMQSKLSLPIDHCYCLGLGSELRHQFIYTYSNSLISQHASILKDVFSDIHHASDIAEIEIEITTLDDFCKNNRIEQINFIKIDTEGNELEVLKGASRLLAENRIDIIQFEFNEMNVISRVFLKDFYSLLNNFDIYRLDVQRIIPLPRYETINEIFKFQNFLAINKLLEVKK